MDSDVKADDGLMICPGVQYVGVLCIGGLRARLPALGMFDALDSVHSSVPRLLLHVMTYSM
jgi:hypothetical protein